MHTSLRLAFRSSTRNFCGRRYTNPARPTVAVVGGGLSGLTAAFRLASMPSAPKVVLLDAGNVVQDIGGRVGSLKMPVPQAHRKDANDKEDIVSYGGTWLQFQDDHLLGLATAIAKETKKKEALPIVPEMQQDIPAILSIVHFLLMDYLYDKGKTAVGYLENPTEKGNAWLAEFDQINLFDALAAKNAKLNKNPIYKLTSEKRLHAVRNWFAMMENEPWDFTQMSALFAAVMVFTRIKLTATGALYPQTMRWKNGTGTFVDCLTLRLTAPDLAVDIRRNSPVTQILTNPNGSYTISFLANAQTETLQVDRVVVATSPSVITATPEQNKICIPGIPHQFLEINNFLIPWKDPCYNLIIRLNARYWLKDNNKTRALLLCPTPFFAPSTGQFFGQVMDLTEDGPRDVIRFLCNPERTIGKTESQLVDEALRFLAASYPDIKVNGSTPFVRKNLVDSRVVDWQQVIPKISVTYYWKLGGYSKYYEWLRKPVAGIYWAGAERVIPGAHWMEGAVYSGNLVAAEVGEALGLVNKGAYLKQLDKANAKAVKETRKRNPGIWHELGSLVNMIPSCANQEDIEKALGKQQ